MKPTGLQRLLSFVRSRAARRSSVWLATLAAAFGAGLVALLPFAHGLIRGHAFFFRDLSRYFFPLRRFYTEGLRNGELRLWNPFVHEGFSDLPLLFYPFDLLQLVRNDEWLFSVLLALHVALAAVAMALLLRSFGSEAIASIGGGLVYALGGFCLSLINLDIALRAFAWAPILVLALRRAADGGRRATAMAALTCGIAISILSPEILAQGVLAAFLLAVWPASWRRLGRLVTAVALGVGLAAAPLLLQLRLIPGSARGLLLETGVSLADSIRPVVWLQVVVANLFGDLYRISDAWWGFEHFTKGFPYILSLYLGPIVLALAVIGLISERARRKRLMAILIVAAAVCLGAALRLDAVVAAVPLLRLLRYPVKAFSTIQLVMALATGAGLSALARGERSTWKTLVILTTALASPLVLSYGLFHWRPTAILGMLHGFFPDTAPLAEWQEEVAFIVRDAALGGSLALIVALVGVLVLARRLRAILGATIVVGLLAADLLRAGAGLNPMVTPTFYRLSGEAERFRRDIARDGGRVFTCNVLTQHEYARARRASRQDGESYIFAALQESFTPHTNVSFSIPTAMSLDLFALVPVDRALDDEEITCRNFPSIRERLWRAGVTHVLSVDPIEDPAIEWIEDLRPPRLAPLVIHVYRMREPLQRIAVASETHPASSRDEAETLARQAGFMARGAVALEGDTGIARASGRIKLLSERPGDLLFEVEAKTPTAIIVRDGFDTAWRARVNGVSTAVMRANGRHIAVSVPAGTSRVELFHRPWQLDLGLVIGALASLVIGAMLLRRRERDARSINSA